MHRFWPKIPNWQSDLTKSTDYLSRLPVLYALQRSLALTLPLVMVSALALLLLFPPFPGLKIIFVSILGAQFETVLRTVVGSTSGVAALLVLIGYAYVYTALINKRDEKRFVSPIVSILVVVSCYFLITVPGDKSEMIETLSISRGLSAAILTGLISTEVFLRLAKIQPLRLHSRTAGHEGVVGDVFALMPAVMVTVVIFALMKATFISLGSDNVVAELNGAFSSAIATGEDTLSFGMLFIFLSQVFWFFGIHGPNVLGSVYADQLNLASDANNHAVALGETPTNFFTSQFFDLQNMGGSGTTLGLVLAILIFWKSPGMRSYAVLACIPAMFNINEPLIYGIPIVLNPVFALPFLLVPVLNTVVMYTAMSIDFMPLTGHYVAWTTPPIVNGYAVTGSINGSVVQAICLLLSFLAYAPFVKLAERVDVLRGQAALSGLSELAENGEEQQASKRLLNGAGNQRRLALALARDLEIELKRRENLFLVYQPQVCRHREAVVGVEALLRWKHPVHGLIPPPVTVQLAEEIGVMPDLGTLVLDMACKQRAAWLEIVPDDFMVSVNVAPTQILKGSLDDTVFEILDACGLPTSTVKLEITETTILTPDDNALASLERLRTHGVRIALDDFGMGHTSLRYLKALPIDEVKIDKSLTHSEPDGVNDYIIMSILDLSRSLGFRTIVEGVETEEQLERLNDLGCAQFQGYYFSQPLLPDQCLRYVLEFSRRDVAAADGMTPVQLSA